MDINFFPSPSPYRSRERGEGGRAPKLCVKLDLFVFLPGSDFVTQHWSINCVVHRTKVSRNNNYLIKY